MRTDLKQSRRDSRIWTTLHEQDTVSQKRVMRLIE